VNIVGLWDIYSKENDIVPVLTLNTQL